MQRIHFIHVSKTGGTAIRHALKPYAAHIGLVIKEHDPHRLRLEDVPVGEKAFFFLRDPVSRFVSAFNSRLRKGQPRYYVEWEPKEAIAFSRFKEPRELAGALGSADPEQQQHALDAMLSIRHVRDTYATWLKTPDYLQSRVDDILWAGQTEHLAEDFATLVELLGLPADTALPQDPVKAHRAPGGSTHMGPAKTATIKKWYAKDYEFIAIADAITRRRSASLRHPQSGGSSRDGRKVIIA